MSNKLDTLIDAIDMGICSFPDYVLNTLLAAQYEIDILKDKADQASRYQAKIMELEIELSAYKIKDPAIMTLADEVIWNNCKAVEGELRKRVRKINAIKDLRDRSGCSLLFAKEMIESRMVTHGLS